MKKIIIAIVLLGVLGVGIGLFMKNKKVAGLEDATPSYTISATQLFEEFAKDETAALNKFRNKILLVEGIIQDIKPVNDSVASILLRADDSGLGTIKCGLGKEYANAVKTINIEETIKIKGVCSGLSKVEDFGITIMDIELSRCVIVK